MKQMVTNSKEARLQLYLLIFVVLFVGALVVKRYVYFQPSQSFYSVEETYKVIKHEHLHGWLAEGNTDAHIVLICHSNTQNVSHMTPMLHTLNSLGFSALAFDYSGFGKSRGSPSEQQLYDDVSRMVTLLRQTYHPSKIVICGLGLGASVATYAARRYDIPTLILISPFPSTFVLIKNTLLKYFPSFFSDFDTLKYLNGYKGRSLVIHSEQDEIVPYTYTAEMRKIATMHVPSVGSHATTQVPWAIVRNFILNQT